MATFIFNIEYPAQYRTDAMVYALARSTDATISANSSVRADLQAVFLGVYNQSKVLQGTDTIQVCRSHAVVTNVTGGNSNQYVVDLVALYNIAPNESSQQLILHIMEALPTVL